MMLKGEILDILFRRIAPEKLLQRLGKTRFCPSKAEFLTWFKDVSETTLHGYSGDEKELLFQGTVAAADDRLTKEEMCPPPFQLLAEYGDEVLERRAGEVRCKFGLTLDWRDAYLKLGQDLIVTAWLAHHAVSDPVRDPDWFPDSFSWPTVIPTNNLILERILEKDGLSENHYHLYGSAAVFALNWSRLMTWPRLGKGISWLKDRLQFRAGRGEKDNQNSLQKNLLTAALLRACLFQMTHGDRVLDCWQELWRFVSFINEEGDGSGCAELLRKIDALRFQYAVPFEQPDGSGFHCLDYAFTQELREEMESDSRILAGERKLLFECFKKCFSSEWNYERQWCFYLYLLLKSDFRQEVIQTNQEIGFRNFQDYERRKFSLWDVSEVGNAYWNEAHRTAIAAPLREQPIQALELRLTPKETADENFKMIYDIDKAMAFYLEKCGDGWDGLPKFPDHDTIDWEYHDLELNPFQEMGRFFFVLHFIKKKDLDETEQQEVPRFACRHGELRDDCRKRARALMGALSAHPYLAWRVRGIDACSNEIGCRPEVFSTAFRFLRACPVWLFRKPKFFHGDFIRPALSVTYHAGEDFLDIVDGLRAIDEAISFLNLRRGDRIGHALALGVSPEIHYETKHNCVTLSKQNLLDNLVWLRFRGEELNLMVSSTLRERIRNLSEDLFSELYKNSLDEFVTLRDYYRSWKLRGDDPILYESAGENGCITEAKPFDEFASFYRTPPPNRANYLTENELENYRKQQNSPAVKLYFLYQFNHEVKIRGRESIRFHIRPDYVRLVGEVQNKMRLYIDSLGLCVECNPSSNVLIGTFDFYRQHPIFLFHKPGPYERNASQLHVSLNTDDQGVFDTSLSFEYAVVAAALMAETTPEGERRYTNREIEDYLRNLQRMGNEQSFRRNWEYGRSF